MVPDHWSNDAMVMMDRCGLVLNLKHLLDPKVNWSRTEACRPLRISTSSSFFADRSWSVTTSSSWQSLKGKSTAGPSNQFVFIIIFVELVIDKNSSFYFIRPTSFFTALDLATYCFKFSEHIKLISIPGATKNDPPPLYVNQNIARIANAVQVTIWL